MADKVVGGANDVAFCCSWLVELLAGRVVLVLDAALLVMATVVVVVAAEVGANEVVELLLLLAVVVAVELLLEDSSDLSAKELRSRYISPTPPLSFRASALSFQLRKFEMNFGGWKNDKNLDLNDDDLTGLLELAEVSSPLDELAESDEAPVACWPAAACWMLASWL